MSRAMNVYETLAEFLTRSRHPPAYVHGIYRDDVLVSWSVHRNWAAREAGKRGLTVKRILLVQAGVESWA